MSVRKAKADREDEKTPLADRDGVISVQGLKTYFDLHDGAVLRAVDDVSFLLPRGRTLAIVGESGSGKSVTARSIVGLVERPGRIVGGHVWFDGQDLVALKESQMRRLRGERVAMIFQDPTSSLDPLKTIGEQLREAISVHKSWDRRRVRHRAEEVLELVGVRPATAVLNQYASDLSSGMIQRVMIAFAISCSPDVMIADEPTTNLGVSVQAEILAVLSDIQSQLGTALLLITHDMGVVAQMADDVLVMYAGRVVERGPMADVLSRPRHPYTTALIRSVPQIDDERGDRLHSIPGFPPNLAQLPPGCAFAPRCEQVVERCRHERPALEPVSDTAAAACFVAQGKASPGGLA